jgi:subtilisin family serine protease
VIAYKALGNQGGFTSDLVDAIDQAVIDGVDVINYSIGGGASVTGGDDIAFLFAADAGVFAATSAGNSGPGPGTIGGPASVPWITSVGASTQSRFFQGTVVLGNGAEYTGASITAGVGPAPLVDAAALGNALCDPAVPFSSSVAGKIVVCQRGVTARAAKSLAVLNAGGVGMIMHENSDAGSLFSDSHWVPSVHVDLTPGLAIKAYIAANLGTATAQIIGEQISTWPFAPSMTDFSSRGPNTVAPDIIKPDVTAPGIQILAGNSLFPDPETTPPGELFQAIAGTSMSSPHVAGVFALLKQAHPEWSAAMAKSALMTTAYQDVLDNNRVSPADPFDMGAGHINPGGPWNKGSITEPGLAYDAGFLDYLGFLCDEGPEVFANPAGTCGALESLGVPTEAHNLNYPSIGAANVPGSLTITRTVTSVAKENGWRNYTVSVDAPPGYTVNVSPSTFSLKKGQSVTYSVSFTNVSAPVGEWRFGSLTWNDQTGSYHVYSPIAVRGALFEAPAEISGSGESGSASFDVKFGYTGSYAAAAHGLVPATVTHDNVLQDANQTFSPSDEGTGGANLHQFNLSGAAFFRIAIPPEATEANADLDVYVFNPSNQLVASSTLGGTDEQVDLFQPADGTWSVYVHGWQAPGGDSDYDMYSWVISETPGGNLTIGSAPTSATNGSTGTVNVSWTGATAGQWHLGAVSHTGDVGLMGLTLINVDNR